MIFQLHLLGVAKKAVDKIAFSAVFAMHNSCFYL